MWRCDSLCPWRAYSRAQFRGWRELGGYTKLPGVQRHCRSESLLRRTVGWDVALRFFVPVASLFSGAVPWLARTRWLHEASRRSASLLATLPGSLRLTISGNGDG